jgi:hypothetical protein
MFGNDEMEDIVPALPRGNSGMQRNPLVFNNNNNNNNNNQRLTNFPKVEESPPNSSARSVT